MQVWPPSIGSLALHQLHPANLPARCFQNPPNPLRRDMAVLQAMHEHRAPLRRTFALHHKTPCRFPPDYSLVC
jgi:hypothetical protein